MTLPLCRILEIFDIKAAWIRKHRDVSDLGFEKRKRPDGGYRTFYDYHKCLEYIQKARPEKSVRIPNDVLDVISRCHVADIRKIMKWAGVTK